MAVRFHFNGSDKRFKAGEVDFAIKSSYDSLQISKISFLSKYRINLRLICLPMKRLCNALLICFVIEFFVNLQELLLQGKSQLLHVISVPTGLRPTLNILMQLVDALPHLGQFILYNFVLRVVLVHDVLDVVEGWFAL